MDTFSCTVGSRGWKWRLVYDPSFTSAQKRAQKGHDVLDYLPSSRTEEEFFTPKVSVSSLLTMKPGGTDEGTYLLQRRLPFKQRRL